MLKDLRKKLFFFFALVPLFVFSQPVSNEYFRLCLKAESYYNLTVNRQ